MYTFLPSLKKVSLFFGLQSCCTFQSKNVLNSISHQTTYFLHLQAVSPSSKFAQAHLCMKEKIWDLRIRPVRAKVAKIKRGRILPRI